MAAWFGLYDKYGWDFETIGKVNPVELSANMIYEAARQGNFQQGKPFSLSFAELTAQVGDMKSKDGDRLKEVFTESAKVIAEKMNEIGGAKKKSNVG